MLNNIVKKAFWKDFGQGIKSGRFSDCNGIFYWMDWDWRINLLWVELNLNFEFCKNSDKNIKISGLKNRKKFSTVLWNCRLISVTTWSKASDWELKFWVVGLIPNHAEIFITYCKKSTKAPSVGVVMIFSDSDKDDHHK